MHMSRLKTAAAALVLIGSIALPATAGKTGAAPNYTTSAVLVGSSQAIGALYQPVKPGPNRSIGLFLTHENDDFIGSVPCVQLAQRGFTVLCVKSQYADQAAADWDELAKD